MCVCESVFYFGKTLPAICDTWKQIDFENTRYRGSYGSITRGEIKYDYAPCRLSPLNNSILNILNI